MPGPHASSEKSLEERLIQCVEELKKNKLSISCVVTEPAMYFAQIESPHIGNGASPNRCNEASPNLHHEGGFKCNAYRVTNDKMGPRHGAVSKPRQQRHTSKGTIKVYPADPKNFRALVYEHTRQLSSTPPPEVAAQPTSPLTPHSISSTSSTWGFTSQPSSPTTPNSIPSNSTSPLSSPHHGQPNGCLYSNNLPFEVQAECSPHWDTQRNVPKPFEMHAEHSYHLHTQLNAHPFKVEEHSCHLNTHLDAHPLRCCANQNLNSSHNTILHQSTYVPRCALMPCLGDSNGSNDTPSDYGRPQGISPGLFARVLSLERYLMD